MKRHNAIEENAGLIAACLALGFYLFVSGIDSAHPKSYLYVEATAYSLPISAFFSVRAVIGFASGSLPAVGWWLRGILRWASWGITYSFAAYCAIGMLAPLNPLMPYFMEWLRRVHAGGSFARADLSAPVLLFFALAGGIPAMLLLYRMVREYAAARRYFGSTAQAERARYADNQRKWGEGCWL